MLVLSLSGMVIAPSLFTSNFLQVGNARPRLDKVLHILAGLAALPPSARLCCPTALSW